MTLYLIRHAHAGQSNPDDPRDHLRPLSPKGRRQAHILERVCAQLGITFGRLFSSPYTRAVETAMPLLARTETEKLETLPELTGDRYGDLLAALSDVMGSADSTVALVGHEPYLSAFTSLLLTGDPQSVKLHFRKSMIVELRGTLAAGGLELRSALTPKRLTPLVLKPTRSHLKNA